jgi:hypothetical protein
MNDMTRENLAERPASTADLASPSVARQQQQRGTAEVVSQMEGGTIAAPEPTDAPLFPADEAEQLRDRWQDVQASFVDEPRRAVQQADELVAGAIKRIAQTFADERSQLEGQWDRGEDVSTEDLRLALQKYRTFFGRLLTV